MLQLTQPRLPTYRILSGSTPAAVGLQGTPEMLTPGDEEEPQWELEVTLGEPRW